MLPLTAMCVTDEFRLPPLRHAVVAAIARHTVAASGLLPTTVYLHHLCQVRRVLEPIVAGSNPRIANRRVNRGTQIRASLRKRAQLTAASMLTEQFHSLSSLSSLTGEKTLEALRR